MLQKSGDEGRPHHSNGLFTLSEDGSVCYTPVTLGFLQNVQAGVAIVRTIWTGAERQVTPAHLLFLAVHGGSGERSAPRRNAEQGGISDSTKRPAFRAVSVRVSQEHVL